MAGTSLDVVEMDAASNNSVDDIRELRENVALAPMGGGRRVYILDEAHMLSTAAWNAFLKTLEEPPPHVVFVLATTEAHKVPATIVDRCHRFDFQRPSLEQIAGVLRRVADEEGIEVPDAAPSGCSRARPPGSFRDALGTLEQLVTYGGSEVELDDVLEILGVADAELVLETAEALVEHDPKAALLAVERLAGSGRDYTQFMRDLAAHLRHLFVVQTLGEVPDSFSVTAEHTDRLAAQAERLAQGEVLRAIDLLAAALAAVKDGSDPRIQLELALLKAVQPQVDLSLQALLFRIEQLERARWRQGATAAARAGRRRRRAAAGARGRGPDHGRCAPTGRFAARADRRRPSVLPAAPSRRRARRPRRAAPAAPLARPSRTRADAPSPAPGRARSATAGAAPAGARASAAPELDLVRCSSGPPRVDAVRQENAHGRRRFLQRGAPVALEGERLTSTFPPDATFVARRRPRTTAHALQSGAAHAHRPRVRSSTSSAADRGRERGGSGCHLSEDELLERLKQQFGAKEVFDDAPRREGPDAMPSSPT